MERRQAQDGYKQLYLAGRRPGPIREAACWLHARRPFFALADVEENARRKAEGNKEIPLSPIAIEVVRRIVKDLQIICANSSPSCRGDMTWPGRLITL